MKRQTSFRKCQHYYLENMAGFKRGYDGKIAGLYDLDKTLGRGHFAVVKLARHVFTGEKVAVKVIDKTKLDTLSTGHLFQEVRCMKLVQHPNIVRLYEVIDTQTKLYLILELGDGGDMFDYIMKHEEGLNEDLAKKYFAQIVHAISYCHKLHVVHRDLKPENVVFFEKPGLVKLTDFGFSNKFQPGKKLTTSCGSLAYSAPEILLGDEYDAPAVDVILGEDEPVPGMSGGKLVNGSKQPSECDLAEVQLQEDSPEASHEESMQLQPVRDEEEELPSAPDLRTRRTEKRQKQ
ncbi:SNF-related serine/threonine-protein kinase-like [Pituophis catenifer annectens]|uniref:SNF-related serine/threonine-protein kinase-like n=1 Tax=Pituophis catenifer annectens TaxID=94852 RepID=UPI0039944965